MTSRILIPMLLHVVFVGLTKVNCQETGITLPPTSLNVTLGSQAAFYCNVVQSDAVDWKVNRMDPNDDRLKALDPDVKTIPLDSIGTFSSTLTLYSSMESETPIPIECVAVSYLGASVLSPVVTLRTQGKLDPPTITEPSEYNASHLILTWNPPFTLDITDLDPDITYTLCTNDTSTCVNTTDTSCISPTSCFPVEYSVSACNPVGCSENATVVYKDTIDVQNLEIVVSPELETLKFTCTFAEGSNAKGCSITVHGMANLTTQAWREDNNAPTASVSMSAPPVGNYEADAYGVGGPECIPVSADFAVPEPPTSKSPVPTTHEDEDQTVYISVGAIGSIIVAVAVIISIAVTVVVLWKKYKGKRMDGNNNACLPRRWTRSEPGVHTQADPRDSSAIGLNYTSGSTGANHESIPMGSSDPVAVALSDGKVCTGIGEKMKSCTKKKVLHEGYPVRKEIHGRSTDDEMALPGRTCRPQLRHGINSQQREELGCDQFANGEELPMQHSSSRKFPPGVPDPTKFDDDN